MLDWQRQKKDFRTRFLDLSTLFGNSVLLLLLFVLLGAINHNMICFPGSLIFNPNGATIPGCNASDTPRNDTQSPNSSTTRDNMDIYSSYQSKDETVVFYMLNMIVCCLVCPLGFASIVNSLSQYWITEVQQMKCVVKLQRHITVQVNGILAGSAILSTMTFAILLLPVGINSIHVTSNSPCYQEALTNIVSSVILSLIGLPSLYLTAKNIAILMKGLKRIEFEKKEKKKQDGKTTETDLHDERKRKMILAIVVTIFIEATITLHLWSVSDLIFSTKSSVECYKNWGLYPVTIFLLVFDGIVLALTSFLSCFYTIKFCVCKSWTRNRNSGTETLKDYGGNGAESIPLT